MSASVCFCCVDFATKKVNPKIVCNSEVFRFFLVKNSLNNCGNSSFLHPNINRTTQKIQHLIPLLCY